MIKLSAVIGARDEAELIGNCIKRLSFVDEIIVVIDNRTTDQTAEIAKKLGAVIIEHDFSNFAEFKNAGIDAANGEWILNIDADERVTNKAASEILEAINQPFDAFKIPWVNYFLAKKMEWGGWQEEHIRLFRKNSARFTGDIHEELTFNNREPRIGTLKNAVAHFSHRSINHMLLKTANYVGIQAQEMYDNHHPKVTNWTFFKVIVHEFLYRIIKKRGYKDGMPGMIEGIYQPFSLFTIYVRLWELQNKPSIEQAYIDLEDKIDD